MRFTEDIDSHVSADFMPRRYLNPLWRVAPFYAAALALIVAAWFASGWLSAPIMAAAAFVLATAICTYCFVQMQSSNDLALANDFQHLLFASAASLGSSFCFFVRQNGTVVYANDATQSLFPGFSKSQDNGLKLLLDEAGVSEQEAKQFFSALTKGQKESLIVSMRLGSHEAKECIVMLQPLARPSGYFVVHGRPYYAQRQGIQKLPGALAQTRIHKIEILLDVLPLGVYLTSDTGIIDYANPALEAMLGYEPRALLGKALPVQSLIYHADGVESGEFGLSDYSGQAMLSGRNQTLVRAYLDQRHIPDHQGRPQGVLGIVTPAA